MHADTLSGWVSLKAALELRGAPRLSLDSAVEWRLGPEA
jgi:hypothetical protein